MILRLETTDGAAVEIEEGVITAVTQRTGDPADPAERRATRADLVLPVGPGILRSGLINAHDHLHRNHYPRLGSPPYEDAYAWGADLHARFGAEIAHAKSLDRRDALLFGALKNILSGVTTVVHHDPWEPAFDDAFPMRVARIRTAHSLGFDPAGVEDLARTASQSLRTAGDPAAGSWGEGRSDRASEAQPRPPFCLHLAEGVNAGAAREVFQLRDRGVFDERLIAVHAVGVDAGGIEQLRAAGAAIVWCPSSNRFLFGRTAPRALIASGVDVLLGTDALLTGDGTILDELRVAAAAGYLDEQRLQAAVGATAARRLGLPPHDLAAGSPADLVLLRKPLLEARARDIGLVLVGGRVVLADAELEAAFEVSGNDYGALVVGGVRKLVVDPLAEVAARAVANSPACRRILD